MNNSLAEVHPEHVSEWSENNLTLTPFFFVNILPLVPLNVIVLYIISEQILKPSQNQMTFSNFLV